MQGRALSVLSGCERVIHVIIDNHSVVCFIVFTLVLRKIPHDLLRAAPVHAVTVLSMPYPKAVVQWYHDQAQEAIIEEQSKQKYETTTVVVRRDRVYGKN